MALSRARIVAVGETPYAHEREGIAFAEQALPDTDPYHLWALVDLLDPTTGRLHEIDLVVLGYSCIYLVELKAWPGRIEGDSVDWTWVTPEGRRLWRDNPRSATKRKAQVLRSRLERALPADVQCPWVEPLVFLSHADVKLSLQPEGFIGVVNRKSFCDAITKHQYPGADPRFHGRTIDRPTMRAVVQALSAIGFRQRKGKLAVGSYELCASTDRPWRPIASSRARAPRERRRHRRDRDAALQFPARQLANRRGHEPLVTARGRCLGGLPGARAPPRSHAAHDRGRHVQPRCDRVSGRHRPTARRDHRRGRDPHEGAALPGPTRHLERRAARRRRDDRLCHGRGARRTCK